MSEKIIVPIDDSINSYRALEFALKTTECERLQRPRWGQASFIRNNQIPSL